MIQHQNRALLGASMAPNAIESAAAALLSASQRVLGPSASPGARFRWINQVLDGTGGEAVPVASLRVECFAQLFPEGRPLA